MVVPIEWALAGVAVALLRAALWAPPSRGEWWLALVAGVLGAVGGAWVVRAVVPRGGVALALELVGALLGASVAQLATVFIARGPERFA